MWARVKVWVFVWVWARCGSGCASDEGGGMGRGWGGGGGGGGGSEGCGIWPRVGQSHLLWYDSSVESQCSSCSTILLCESKFQEFNLRLFL